MLLICAGLECVDPSEYWCRLNGEGNGCFWLFFVRLGRVSWIGFQDGVDLLFCVAFMAGKGADPKSPVGTAFSFSRPKRQATLIANVSRVLQFASKRFVNSFLNV